MSTSTPWGRSQQSHRYARGIVGYSTAGHGGVHLSKTRNALVHPAWQRANGWYEEDLEWNIVAFSFPDVFGPEKVAGARRALKDGYPDEFTAVTGEKVDLLDSHVLRARAQREQHKNDYVTIAAWGDWHSRVPAGMVGVCAVPGGRPERGAHPHEAERWFLVPLAEYEARSTIFGDIGFVVALVRHAAIDPIQTAV